MKSAVEIEHMLILEALESFENIFVDIIVVEADERKSFLEKYGVSAEIGHLILEGIIRRYTLGHEHVAGSDRIARLTQSIGEQIAASISVFMPMRNETVSIEDTLTQTHQRRVVAGRNPKPVQRQQIARGTVEPVACSDGEIPDRPITHEDCVRFLVALRGTRKLVQYKISDELAIPYSSILDMSGRLKDNLPLWHRLREGPYLDDEETESVCRFILFHEPVRLKRLEWESDAATASGDEAVGPTAEPDRAGTVKCNQCSERFSPKDALQHKRLKHPVTENPRGSEERSLIGNTLK